MSRVSTNERRHYMCNIFSHLLQFFSAIDKGHRYYMVSCYWTNQMSLSIITYHITSYINIEILTTFPAFITYFNDRTNNWFYWDDNLCSPMLNTANISCIEQYSVGILSPVEQLCKLQMPNLPWLFDLMLWLTQIAKFKGPTWGPHGSCWPQMGPMLIPWTLLSGRLILSHWMLWPLVTLHNHNV